jgi:hypothetical protein
MAENIARCHARHWRLRDRPHDHPHRTNARPLEMFFKRSRCSSSARAEYALLGNHRGRDRQPRRSVRTLTAGFPRHRRRDRIGL